jgi:transglutaminase-like putative cysteine protease
MAAPTVALRQPFDPERFLRGLMPAEGWITLIAVTGLSVTFAWSLEDAGWIPSVQGGTDYLPVLAILATAVGIVLAKAGLGRLRTDLVGSIIGGLLLPLIMGSVVLAKESPGLGPDGILARYRAAAEVATSVWTDLVVNGQPFTTQYGHYHLFFGALVWAAGLLAASAAVGRRRPLDAVVVTGLLLLTNEAITAREQLPFLVLFTLAALTLLIRTHVFEEQIVWARRHIGDPSSVSSLYLRGGAAFVGAAVLGALILTGSASSAPLQGIWADMPQRLADFGRIIQQLGPGGGASRPAGVVGFGPNAVTSGLWSPNKDQIAFTAHLPANDSRAYHWRAGTYATYTNFGWQWGPTQNVARGPNAPLLSGTGDDPLLDIKRTPVQIVIDPQAYIDAAALSPATIDTVDRSSTLVGVGDQARFVSDQLSGRGPYTIDALVPNLGDATSGLTENRLRAAGRNYPLDIKQLYLQVPDGAIGPAAQALLARIEAEFGSKDAAEAKPYDLARAMETYLRDPSHFTYATDVQAERDSECSGLSSVECFARIRMGYCEYYASTMTILLRAAGVPARVAYGFLPGDRQPDGTEIVSAAAQHWWVEAYFPSNGWVEFDPTGGGLGQPEALESGAPVTPPPAGLVTTPPDEVGTDPVRRGSGRPDGAGSTFTPRDSGPFGVVAIVLFLAVLAVGITARRRSGHQPMHPDQAWGGLGRLAGRFGFGPRPQQTVYEYAGALGEVVPAVQVELTTVASAKVEVAYGRHELGEDRLRVVGDAYRRLRLAVLRAGVARRLGGRLRRGGRLRGR